jgi:EAL domain-containing protein (putative c-di-GMP-specific phosphodiesterase class I)
MCAMPSLDAIEEHLSVVADATVASFKGLRLHSAFQPVFGLAHGRAVGYEGLLRATDPHGTAVPPLTVFKMAHTVEEVVLLDTLCRTIHALNFARMSQDHWLFLNVSPTVFADQFQDLRDFFSSLVARCGLPPNRIVVEILESALHKDIAAPMAFYREQGGLVAVDDFGAGHSNLDRVWRLKPDIVKLDRVLLRHTNKDRTSRMFLKRMVSTMHEAGSLVLIEGVEDESEAVIAMDSDVDLTQGFHFGRPAPSLDLSPDAASKFELLYQQFHRIALLESKDFRAEVTPYSRAIEMAGGLMKSGTPFHTAVGPFLALPFAERCYLLDRSGRQIGNSILSSASASKINPRFAPVTRDERSYWGHRHYFRRAVSRPGQIHLTRPYLSLPTAQQCVTASIGIAMDKVMYVLCGDIAWNEDFSTDVTLP